MAEAFSNKDYTSVNFSAVSDLTAEWSLTINEFIASYMKASEDPTFQKLEELGFSGGFPGNFDKVMESYATDINSVISSVNAYFEELSAQDDAIADQMPENPRGSGGRNRGGGSGSGDSETVEEMLIEAGIDNTEAQLKFFEDISLSDLTEVLNGLNTVATDNNLSIDEILDDETLSAKLKEILLTNVNLSEEYRTMVGEGSTVALVTSLKSLVKGEVKSAFGLDQDTLLTLKSHLTSIASDNSLEYKDLLGSEEHSSILKTGLSSMSSVTGVLKDLTADNVQSKLLSIYDGDYPEGDSSVDSTSQGIIRSEVDILSSLTDISYEELLTVPDYGEEMFKSTERLQRTSLFADTLSKCKGASDILSSLIS